MSSSGGRPLHRRRVLLAGLTSGGLILAGCSAGAEAQNGSAAFGGQGSGPGEMVPPTENLMREHGVLERILLIYEEAGRRLRDGQHLPPDVLHEAAQIVMRFIHQYHEQLEEKFVFIRLREASQSTRTVDLLTIQHTRGRELTQDIVSRSSGRSLSTSQRTALLKDMTAFSRMYVPHESREDTVVFPRLREVMGTKAFNDLGERFEEIAHRHLGGGGVDAILDRVVSIEKILAIHDLEQFTPQIRPES